MIVGKKCNNKFCGTVSDGGEQQCIHRQVVPLGGTEVDMMGVDRLLQLMSGGADRARSSGSFRPYYTHIMAYTAYNHPSYLLYYAI